MFSGSIPALVTPFATDGSFDETAYRDLIEWQIEQGSSGLVACGTTGEAATLTAHEHFQVVRVCVDQTKGRVPVIAGAGSNDTRVASENLIAAKDAGADAALMVPPYYNRPSQDGIFRHFAKLAENCPLPIILYNVPSRTVTDIQPETLISIVQTFPGIFVGIKDASGILRRVTHHRALLGSQFCQLSGNDDLALAFNALGGAGCISVTANAAPGHCAEFQSACAQGRMDDALRLHDQLFPLHEAMFVDASPGPVKYALARARPGFPSTLRLPMTLPNDAAREAVDAGLKHIGML